MTQNMRNTAPNSFETEVENVLILPGVFLRERIISSTSAEDTGAKYNVFLFKYILLGILLIKDVFCTWFYAHHVLTKIVRTLYIPIT